MIGEAGLQKSCDVRPLIVRLPGDSPGLYRKRSTPGTPQVAEPRKQAFRKAHPTFSQLTPCPQTPHELSGGFGEEKAVKKSPPQTRSGFRFRKALRNSLLQGRIGYIFA